MEDSFVPTLGPLQEKIEKLKTMLSEGDTTGHNNSDNQGRREEKLLQKLRYLQFYAAYNVGESPADWRCTHCREVSVMTTSVTYPGCSMQGKCKHRVSHKKEIRQRVSKWVCDNSSEHKNEWEQGQKSQIEVRNTIKRDFSAMVAKEKELKVNRRLNAKENKVPQDDDVKVLTKPTRCAKKEETPIVHNVLDNNSVDGPKPQENLHSGNCKTCIKMQNLMGKIIPHPINV